MTCQDEPVCPGVCDLKDDADSRELKAKARVMITDKAEFVLLGAEPEVLGLFLNMHKECKDMVPVYSLNTLQAAIAV